MSDTLNPSDAAAMADAPDAKDPKANQSKLWRARIGKTKTYRRTLISNWSENVDFRRGKPFEADSDQDRIQVTIDWSATKAKQAQLFSQMPEVRLLPKRKQYAPAVPTFARKLNEVIGDAGTGSAMDECLPDVINAAGIAGVLVSYEALTVDKEVPTVDAMMAQQLQAAGQKVPTQVVPQVVDYRFITERISPGDILWDTSFTHSDFDRSAWNGRSGRLHWAEAQRKFGLSEEDREKVVGGDTRQPTDKLVISQDIERKQDEDLVNFDEVFYWRHVYHPEETSYDAIQHMVFVEGKDEPVINEPWKGQKRNSAGKVIGSCKLPVRILTLTYISDEAIPPSDSAMGRPQVNELIEGRSDMLKQRKNSLPIRGFDVNRIAPEVQTQLMRGTWQGMIPCNGDGSRAIWEVARAAYPREDFEFDRVAKGDLSETWQVSASQLGGNSGPAIRSASEANIMQANFSTRVGYERARVVKFFVGIAEVLAGLLALYGEFDAEEQQALQAWNREELSNYYIYNVRADSTVLLDANQRRSQLSEFLNLTGKSGFVNAQPVIEEMAALSGLDPAVVVAAPQPKAPEPLNISLRLTGAEDLSNPAIMALLMQSGQAPSPQEIEAAKQLIMAAAAPVTPPQGQPGAPPAGPQTPPVPEDPNPDWNTMSRVEKRTQDGQIGQ